MKRTISVVSLTLGLFFLSFGLVIAGPAIEYDQIITGQGIPSSDIGAVQAAVDLGGKILLKGAFNFGNGRVLIKNNSDGSVKEVEIYGERDKKGNPVTIISGGFWSFLSPLPSTVPITLPGPKITINGIHFKNSIWAPIYIAHSSGVSITGNEITNLIPYTPQGFPFSLSAGIICGPIFLTNQKYFKGAVTGQLNISNNYINLESTTPSSHNRSGYFC